MARPHLTWVISDLHLYHDAIMRKDFENRPSDYMDKILKNLKRYVEEQDTTIFLGDIILYKHHLLKGFLDQVNGRKILTQGNHDKKKRGWYMRNGFDFVVDQFVWDNIVFSHKPLKTFPQDVSINVHGHLHRGTKPTEDWYQEGSKHRLFVLEHIYAPIELQKFLSMTKVSQ